MFVVFWVHLSPDEECTYNCETHSAGKSAIQDPERVNHRIINVVDDANAEQSNRVVASDEVGVVRRDAGAEIDVHLLFNLW